MVDEKEVSLKELIRLGPDYLCIQELDTDGPWLYASKDFKVEVEGETESFTRRYRVSDLTDIGLSCYDKGGKPKSISFHCGDLETLMCLLAHKVDSLHVSYYRSNQSDYMRDNDVDCETIRINGFKGKRIFSVGFDNPRSTRDHNQFAFQANF